MPVKSKVLDSIASIGSGPVPKKLTDHSTLLYQMSTPASPESGGRGEGGLTSENSLGSE